MVRLIIKQVHLSQDGCHSGSSYTTFDIVNPQLESALSGNTYTITTIAGAEIRVTPEGLPS